MNEPVTYEIDTKWNGWYLWVPTSKYEVFIMLRDEDLFKQRLFSVNKTSTLTHLCFRL